MLTRPPWFERLGEHLLVFLKCYFLLAFFAVSCWAFLHLAEISRWAADPSLMPSQKGARTMLLALMTLAGAAAGVRLALKNCAADAMRSRGADCPHPPNDTVCPWKENAA